MGSGSGSGSAAPRLTFWTLTVRRAEEEDEHLERTLEQNKGRMAKKEEKCVVQWRRNHQEEKNQEM